MILKYTPTSRGFCRVYFTVNGIGGDQDDFGYKYDRNPDKADEYGCGNMQFTKRRIRKAILVKYNITRTEYDEICAMLRKELAFGQCSNCV